MVFIIAQNKEHPETKEMTTYLYICKSYKDKSGKWKKKIINRLGEKEQLFRALHKYAEKEQ